MKWLATISLVVAVAGCANDQPSDEARTTSQALDSVAERPELPAVPGQPNKAAVANSDPTPAGPLQGEVDWAEAKGYAHIAAKELPASERVKLDAIRLPVLSYGEAGLLRDTLLTHNQNWYVLSANHDGLNVVLKGTRNEVITPGIELNDAALRAADNYTFTRTHTVVTVAWRAFGASYSLDLECARPMDDTRCSKDEFALNMIESLGVIGGKP